MKAVLQALEAELGVALDDAIAAVVRASGVTRKRAKESIQAYDLEDIMEADDDPGANHAYGYYMGVAKALATAQGIVKANRK